jgi:hypothetical protein
LAKVQVIQTAIVDWVQATAPTVLRLVSKLIEAYLIGPGPRLVPRGVDMMNDSIFMQRIRSRVGEHRVEQFKLLGAGRRQAAGRRSVSRRRQSSKREINSSARVQRIEAALLLCPPIFPGWPQVERHWSKGIAWTENTAAGSFAG